MPLIIGARMLRPNQPPLTAKQLKEQEAEDAVRRAAEEALNDREEKK